MRPFLPRPLLMYVILATLAAVMSLSGCSGQDAEKKPAAKAAEPAAVMVQAKAPVVADVPVYGEYVGRLAAKENVEVRARLEGYLKERNFTEGSIVKKGDLLFVIEPRQYQENLQKAKAELERQNALFAKAKVDLSRFEQLYKQQAVSRDEYDTRLTNQRELSANVDHAKAAVDAAERDLGYTRIIAPITGRIGKTYVNVGNLVGKGDNTLLAEISTTDPMYADFAISERDYLEFSKARHANGDKDREFPLTLLLADDSVYPHQGQADMADRALDAKTGTLAVRGIFPNPQGLLKPGQFAKIRALLEQRQGAMLVPQRAIVDVQGTKSVYVVGKDNRIEAKAVTLGGSKDGSYVIDAGLTPTDMVVVEGLSKVRPGALVKIVPAPDAPAAPAAQAATPTPPAAAPAKP
ncbi:efflux RND transporter periplasmic adaptor subunit [Desulfovibrio sp. TomC]|uniref:efflux RND transporter periplasmic adaptor subunit n=1 Tax=Desulfovibrio sp. TomC TaxID=1562888 RepID=UPI0005733A1B|nr:efflux RND transporter periplasmic adaptor subunit [Desulfovibrio sp. TomC]KHK01299.1 RND efflux system, membrane fusion protein CmeA [Desulfovibrio sp. TomC]